MRWNRLWPARCRSSATSAMIVGPGRVDDLLGLVEQAGDAVVLADALRLDRAWAGPPRCRTAKPRRPDAGCTSGSRRGTARAPRGRDRDHTCAPCRRSRRSGSRSACSPHASPSDHRRWPRRGLTLTSSVALRPSSSRCSRPNKTGAARIAAGAQGSGNAFVSLAPPTFEVILANEFVRIDLERRSFSCCFMYSVCACRRPVDRGPSRDRSARQHGVVGRRQVIEAGGTDSQMQPSLVAASGRWEPVPTRGSIDWVERRKATASSSGQHHLAAGLRTPSSATRRRPGCSVLTGFRRSSIVVTRPPPKARRVAGATVHQISDLDRRWTWSLDGLPVTTSARTIVDLAAVCSRSRLSRAFEDGLVSGTGRARRGGILPLCDHAAGQARPGEARHDPRRPRARHDPAGE